VTSMLLAESHPAIFFSLFKTRWGIRLILEALISFLPTPADGAIGALDWSSAERKRLAIKSQSWECPRCGKAKDLLPKLKPKPAAAGDDAGSDTKKKSRFQKEIEQLQALQQQAHANDDDDDEKSSVEQKQSTEGNDAAAAGGTEDNKEKEDPSMYVTPMRKKGGDDDSPRRVDDFGTSKDTTPPLKHGDGEEEETEIVFVREGDDDGELPPHQQQQQPAVPASQRQQQQQAEDDAGAVVDNSAAANAAAETNDIFVDEEYAESQGKIIDPIMQAIIVVLSIICYLLFRKTTDLLEDLRALD